MRSSVWYLVHRTVVAALQVRGRYTNDHLVDNTAVDLETIHRGGR